MEKTTKQKVAYQRNWLVFILRGQIGMLQQSIQAHNGMINRTNKPVFTDQEMNTLAALIDKMESMLVYIKRNNKTIHE